MKAEEYLNIITEEEYKLIYELVQNGKLKEYHYLVDMFDKEKNDLVLMMDKTPEEVYDAIIKDYLMVVKGVAKLTPGLSTGIKDAKSGATIYTYGGKTERDGEFIDENTRFDLASISKMFTTLLALKLAEDGKFDLDMSVSKCSNGKYNLDIPIQKMAKFYYQLETDGRIDDKNGSLSLKEIQRRLSNTKVVKDHTFIYSDIPFIILKDLLPQADENFQKYFNEELDLFQTSYDRSFGTLTGGKEGEPSLVHDPKARVFERYNLYPGHAGIFSSSKDLVKLFDGLDNGFLSNESIINMITPAIDTPILLNEDGSIAFKKDKSGNVLGVQNINRGMGVYYKHPEGIRVNEIVNVMSDEAFAISGFTGTWASFDLKNELTANILANPLSDEMERDVTVDNQKFLIKDCNKSFKDGTKLKVAGKFAKVLDENGQVLDRAPFIRLTNALKEAQIYTLLKLRLAKKVLKRQAVIEGKNDLNDEVRSCFEKEKVLKA